MEYKNVWHIPLMGGKIDRAIITTLNFITDVVFEKIIKPNSEKLEVNLADTNNLKQETTDMYEQQLDTQYELELAKDELVDQMEQQLDLEFRVSQLEDNIGG